MRMARFALNERGARDVLYFCLHISDILFEKNPRAFEQEIAEATAKGTPCSLCAPVKNFHWD
jgi:hypothetical protein